MEKIPKFKIRASASGTLLTNPKVKSELISQSVKSYAQEWLKEHPEVTHWVAVDDLNMGKEIYSSYGDETREWGLTNFVWTPLSTEGIKQAGKKEKILKFLQ